MGILIAYLLGILTALKPKHQNGNGNQTSPDSHKDQNSINRPIQVICIPPTQSKEEQAENKKKNRRKIIKFRVEMGSALVLFVYAALTAVIAFYSIRAANAAKKAAGTAFQQFQFAQTQFRMEQRPYISPTPRAGAVQNVPHWMGKDKNGPPSSVEHVPIFRVPVATDGSYRYAFAVDIKNYGRSPAVNMVTTVSKVIVGPASEARKNVIAYVPEYSPHANPPLMPGDAQTVKSERNEELPIISLAQDKLIAKGDWEIYIVGGVRYEDILAPSIPPYETIYCFQVNPSGLPFGGCEIRKTTIR